MLGGLVAASCLAGPGNAAEPATQFVPYLDSEALRRVPFGTHSHEIEPWLSYVEVVPAGRFLRGTGIVHGNDSVLPPPILSLLSDHGIANIRIEIGWSKLDADNLSRLIPAEAARLSTLLKACRKRRLRPLILLNAHQGQPVPAHSRPASVSADAPFGARMLKISSLEGIIPGFSGLSNVTDPYLASEIIVTSIDEKTGTLHLSKPLPRSFVSGETVQITTLSYEPFSVPGTPRNEATLKGWLAYVDVVHDFLSSVLQTQSHDDKGYDLEIWNELSFGTKFLSINNYYEPKLFAYDETSIWDELAERTAQHVAQSATRFAGVSLVNGFASTIPWTASSKQHPRINALAKHPYAQFREFPRDEQVNTTALDNEGRPIGCVPAYKTAFPEYFATAIQTETIIRDLSPSSNDIYGIAHGRFARMVNGAASPVSVWLTEAGIAPNEGAPASVSPDIIKMRAALRYFLFFLNKGAERVFLFNIDGGDTGYGLVPDATLRAARDEVLRDTMNDSLASPALQVLGRTVKVMRQDWSDASHATRELKFSVDAQTPRRGKRCEQDASSEGGTLVLLPYEVNPRRLVVAYYAMTRNILDETAPYNCFVAISGQGTSEAELSSYDPVTDQWKKVDIVSRNNGTAICRLTVAPTPQLLLLEYPSNV